MTPKEFLNQAWRIEKRIDRKIEERERLNAKLTSGRSANLTGMPRGGGGDWTDSAARLIEMDKTLHDEILELCRVKREVHEAISAIAEVKYRMVLELRYCNYMSWPRIAEDMGYDLRNVYILHGKALLRVKVPPQ